MTAISLPETYDKATGLRLIHFIMYALLSLDIGEMRLHGEPFAATIRDTLLASKWHRLTYIATLTVLHRPCYREAWYL